MESSPISGGASGSLFLGPTIEIPIGPGSLTFGAGLGLDADNLGNLGDYTSSIRCRLQLDDTPVSFDFTFGPKDDWKPEGWFILNFTFKL